MAKSPVARRRWRGGRGAHQRLRGPARECRVAQEHGEQVPPRKVRRAGAAVPVKHLPRTARSSGRGRARCVCNAWLCVVVDSACSGRECAALTPKNACAPGPSYVRPEYASTLGTAICASSMEYRCPCAAAEPHRTVGM